MAIIFDLEDRRVIPNWRDYKRTIQLGELSSYNGTKLKLANSIDRAIEDWKLEKNIGTAADLVNSAFVSGLTKVVEVNEAITYILSNKNQSSQTLIELSSIIKENDVNDTVLKQSILELDINTVEEFQGLINNKALFRIINKTKNKAKNEVYNPIVWVDLARLYSLRGLNDKAERCIKAALHLAPSNRFVLRSATRFFIHTEKFEQALYYLRKSDNLKSDPWLVSAHIATSSIMGRYSPLIKEGFFIINSKKYSPFQITELASSIGTFEYREGTFKKAKELFNASMQHPNDNSLAQMEWISKKDSRFIFNSALLDCVTNPFEAYAYDSYNNGNWNDSFNSCIKWFLDIPFSKRPIILGSFLAGSVLKDKKSAILLSEIGLQANPNDPLILNNLLYDVITSEVVDEKLLDKYLKKVSDLNLYQISDENKVPLQATLGLINIRKKNIELGQSLYELAIKNAENIGNENLKNLAIINYTREIIKFQLEGKEYYSKIVLEMQIDPKRKDLKFLRDEVVELIMKDSSNKV